MKKLMIAAAIVCAAVLSHAASTQWQNWTIGTKSFKMSDGVTNPNGTQVYLMDTHAATWSALSTILTDGGDYANLAAVLAGEEFAGALVDDTKKTYYNAMPQLVANNYGQVKDGKFGFAESVVDPVSSIYAILVTDGEKYLISAGLEGTSYADDPNDGIAPAFAATHFTTAGGATGWQEYTAASVPEPTSGLLLLLGVAGLALRRRRA